MNESINLFIPVVLGTAHEGNQSQKAARFVYSVMSQTEGVMTELVDVADFSRTATLAPKQSDETAEKWRAIAKRADGFMIVTPEYNHGYPGELKMLLDSAYAEYEKKPVALCGVSAGGLGGARVVDLIKPTLVELKLVPARGAMYFSKIGDAFDESGGPKDPELSERLKGLIDELLWLSRALKIAREKSTQ